WESCCAAPPPIAPGSWPGGGRCAPCSVSWHSPSVCGPPRPARAARGPRRYLIVMIPQVPSAAVAEEIASGLQHAPEKFDILGHLRVGPLQFLDLAHRMDDRRVVASAEAPADLGQAARGERFREIHRHLPRPRHRTRPP